MNMLVEYAISPLAIGTRKPRFSWEVPLEGRGRRQSAYRVLVATCKERLTPGNADLWDSGKVESAQSVNVVYGGAALRSNMDCWWSVQVWDEQGGRADFSPAAYFGTALLDEAEWQAQWIGMGDPGEPFPDVRCYQRGTVPPEVAAFQPNGRAPMLRREFTLDRPVKRARVFVCGLGLYDLHLNGRRVGEDVLATPRTDFRKRAVFNTYDLTGELRQGTNALGLLLGNGWFNGQKRFWGWQQQWYGSPRAILQVEIEFEDGTRDRIVTDGAWRGDWSPITFNCIYDGEAYDARLEQAGWDEPGFDAAGWQPVNRVPAPGGALVPMNCDPEQVAERFSPMSMVEPEPGVTVYDMGRNITGWVRLRVKGAPTGQSIKLRFGEAMHADGRLNAASNNAARQTDEYICRGGAEETWEPRFTYHGFQFVELTGYPGKPDLDTLQGCFVRTAVRQTGNFACGSALINQIHRCTLQSQLCNVQMGVPTDDTQRPERLGWGADVWGTATQALYNLWMPRVYAKWIADIRDGQDECGVVGMIAPQAGSEEDLVWSSSFLLVPWWQYLHTADTRVLEENYPAMKRYMAFLERVGQKDVATVPSGEVINKILWRCGLENRFPEECDRGHLQISQWGDHLSLAEGYSSRSNLPLSVATAFYYLDAITMADIASVLGEQEDARRYGALADAIKGAFNARFFDANVGYYDTGTQSAQAWPLAFGLVPEEHRDRVGKYLVGSVRDRLRHLTTGYVGTRYAIQVLADAGRNDVVWKLATSAEYPSWGHMLRLNRTTSCERWDGEGGSLNHAALGSAIDEWFYWGLAGICPEESAPGFERIVFKPYLPLDLQWAQASLRTVRGTVSAAWRHDGSRATLSVRVPANSTATVHLPTDSADHVTESGVAVSAAEGISSVAVEEGSVRLNVGSGDYRFEFSLALMKGK